MKQFLTGFLLILISITAFSQEKNTAGQFTLSGQVNNPVSNTYFYLRYTNPAGVRVLDSAALTNGKFKFQGTIDGAIMGFLSNKLKITGSEDPNYTPIFMEAKPMQVNITGNNLKSIKLTGSLSNDEFQILHQKQDKLEKKWANVMDTLSAVNKRSNAAYQEMKDWVLVPYRQDSKELDADFIHHYPKSYVTAYLLSNEREMPVDSLKKIYDGFPGYVKESFYGRAALDQFHKRAVGVPGAMAVDFSTVDINGKLLKLSDYKGKYVLLDFWASWCVPCRKSNPHLKELYSLYKDKGFEIIGVSDDDRNPDAWRDAVKKDGLPWKHVLHGLKKGADGMLVSDKTMDINGKYNISGLPTQVLVDPDGKIIWRSGVEGDDQHMLDQKLKSVIKI